MPPQKFSQYLKIVLANKVESNFCICSRPFVEDYVEISRQTLRLKGKLNFILHKGSLSNHFVLSYLSMPIYYVGFSAGVRPQLVQRLPFVFRTIQDIKVLSLELVCVIKSQTAK